MSRCGCSSQCSCIVTGAGGILVTGNGSPSNPYVVTPVGEDPAFCAAVGTCLAAIAGPGLIYSPASNQLQVKLSADDGNTLSFGSDGGLFDAGGSGPTPDTGGKTVAGLPPTGIAGSWGQGAGYLIAPDGMEESFRQAVALQLDITSFTARALADGTLVCAPSSDMTQYITKLGDGKEAWVENIADNGLGRFKRYQVTPGDPAKNDMTIGWWGWLANNNPSGFQTVTEVFGICGRRTVLSVQPGDAESWGSLLELILVYGLTKSVIVHQVFDFTADALSNFAAYKNAGVACMQRVRSDADAGVLTADALKAAGVGWVCVETAVSDATITAYKDAGLQVLMHTHSHHFETDRATTLGIRGVLAEDPVYASKDASRYRYPANRLGSMNGQRHWWYGMLTVNTWNGARWSGSNINSNYRGYFYSWSNDDTSFHLNTGTGNRAFGVLLGAITPPNPQRYTFTVNVRFNTAPADKGRWVGAAFAAPNDRPWDSLGVGGPNSGYAFGLSYDGMLRAWKSDPVGGPVTYTPVATGLAMALNKTFPVTVAVDPDKIVITCNGKSLTINDKTFRGPYAHVCKHEGTTPFRCGWSSWGYS